MTRRLIFALGFLSLIPYGTAWWMGDLRRHTVGFIVVFFIAFALYAGVTALALRLKNFSRRDQAAAFFLAVLMHGLLIHTPPSLSDDMYRYVWNGRVQAAGISPYQYPPNAPELTHLRDDDVWPSINRKSAVTVYPPAAESAYALLWRVWPDSVRWFQVAMSAGGLLAAILLLQVLREAGQSPARVLIYLWSPLLAFETAHAAHVDGLILPLLVGAWWARLRQRDGLVGLLLGLATAMKFYPALLLPALWRPYHKERSGKSLYNRPGPRWRLPVAFVLTIAACYTPYVVQSGAASLGYLPRYFGERFNMGPFPVLLISRFNQWGIDPNYGVLGLLLLVLAAISLFTILRPAADAVTAVRRCIWPIGAFTLLTQNLFAWYMLWLLPLLALFVRPGEAAQSSQQSGWSRLSSPLRLDAWSGWWLFSGLVALSYSFFVSWRPVPAAIWSQFLPLYAFLLIDMGRWLTRDEGRGTKDEGRKAIGGRWSLSLPRVFRGSLPRVFRGVVRRLSQQE